MLLFLSGRRWMRLFMMSLMPEAKMVEAVVWLCCTARLQRLFKYS
jgi:hypothetical protein